MHPVLIDIPDLIFGFDLVIRYYSLMYIIALLMFLYFVPKYAATIGFKRKEIEDVIMLSFLFGIIGARIYYVIFSWDFYASDPISALYIWRGGLAIHGAIIGSVSFIIVYAFATKQSPLVFFDMGAPFVILSQGIGRFGNYANGEASGVPVYTPASVIFSNKDFFTSFWYPALEYLKLSGTPNSLEKLKAMVQEQGAVNVTVDGVNYVLREYVTWGVSFPAEFRSHTYQMFGTLPVHPTFFYEMILNFIAAAVMMYLLYRKKSIVGFGILGGMYGVSYGVIRFFVSFFRTDDLMLMDFRAPHVTSLVMVAIGTAMIVYGVRKYRASQTAS